jgi:hypothetical protein
MVKQSMKKGGRNIPVLIDDLSKNGFFSSYAGEMLDDDLSQLLEEFEMQSTMNAIVTMEALGNLDSDGHNFIATFTEQGSSAVMKMSYTGEFLNVTFRKSPQTEYQYIINEDQRSRIYNEVMSTLADGEGSVGRLIQNMISTQQIQLA